MSVSPLPKLYAILDVDVSQSRGLVPLDVLGAWLDAGVRLVQLRAKALASGPMLDLADRMIERARSARAIVIINDRADVAQMAGAAGVHVGQDDLSPADARSLLGPTLIVGVSTHSEAQVEAACRDPVSYLAIGPVFRSSMRMAVATPVGEPGVTMAAKHAGAVGLPVVGIGGISVENAPGVIAAGAAAVAVISGLVGGDPGASASAYLRALD